MPRILTIRDFWTKRLSLTPISGATPVQGWTVGHSDIEAFMEAPLSPSEDSDLGQGFDTASMLLISAPGAVGKSTLARKIAFETNAVYVDLATSDPVGGNSISGGLAKSNLFSQWQHQQVALLIDGLDEARLRVTQGAFDAFLQDVAQLSRGRAVPTVLFGRTGAVQDAWPTLAAGGESPAILEIGFYDPEASQRFALSRLTAKQLRTPSTAEVESVELVLARLRDQTQTDGDRFAGYAPVLQAVADRIGAEANPSALVAQIRKGEQAVTLATVGNAILDRERSKLSALTFSVPAAASRLYSREEQLSRLAAMVYGTPAPAMPPLQPTDAQIYSDALATWLPEHPFLKTQTSASSVVFEAMIAAHALRETGPIEEAAARKELSRGPAANPFLSEFYLPDSEGTPRLPGAHIGILYSSLRARLSLGDTANLSVEGPEGDDNEGVVRAEVEITLARRDTENSRVLKFDTGPDELIKLGSYLEDIEISAPEASVEIGPGSEALLVAPVSVQCNALGITTEKVVVDPSRSSNQQVVFLEATALIGDDVAAVPVVRSGVSFAVSWPESKSFPWTAFAAEPTSVADPEVEEGLRRFRKFIVAFRSHSKGNLARYKAKIDHRRMTKGSGKRVLDHLLRSKILSAGTSMYYLDSDLLGEVAGATYSDAVRRQYGPTTIAFVEKALRGN